MGKQNNIMQLQMIEQEVNRLSQQLQIIEQNLIELQQLNFGLDEIKNATKKEILAGIGKGIYIPAEIKDTTFLVEVGNKNFVKKSISETKTIIKEQIDKISLYKVKIISRIEDLEKEMNNLIE
jgi:prefoldin alpha subunit